LLSRVVSFVGIQDGSRKFELPDLAIQTVLGKCYRDRSPGVTD